MSRMSDDHINTASDRADDAEAEVRRLTEENARLRALLSDMEWSVEETPFFHCPSCMAEQGRGHAPDCRLKATLEG